MAEATEDIFDLRLKSKLSISDAKLIDDISENVRIKYNYYVGSYIKENKLSDIELLLTSTCRNTISTNLYDVFCRLELLELKLQKGFCPTRILVDNYAQEHIVSQQLNKYKYYNVAVDCQDITNRNIFILVTNLLKSIYLSVNSYVWPRLFRVKIKPDKKITYLDTYLFIDSIDENGKYFERYYTDHEKYIPTKTVESEWFVPTLVDIKYPKEFIKICKDLKKTDKQFLLQESWLTVTDYLYALIFSIILPFRVKSYPLYNGYDVSILMKMLVKKDIGAPALFKSLCQYRFIRRLSKEKIIIKHAINWAENQNIDRALNLGFKEYYPRVKVYGYQGFHLLEYYAALQPTCYELESGTLPYCLCVISHSIRDAQMLSCDKLKIKLSPAFRFSYLYDVIPKQSELLTVLIALPGFAINENREILNMYLEIADSMPENTTVIVKQHPAYTIEKFTELVPEFSNHHFSHTTKKISEFLGEISVLISSATSVCVEAVALGIPVLVYGNRYGVTKNSIPLSVPSDLWSVFYTADELKAQIDHSIYKTDRQPMISDLFCEINEELSVSLFVNE